MMIGLVFEKLNQWDNEERSYPPVSINVSVLQLTDNDLLEFVKEKIGEYSIDPHRVIFEITETALMDNIEYARALLVEFQALGFQISLDDFGTGYSSLAVIQSIPIDKLKIDRTFISDLSSHKGGNMLRIIAMIGQQF
jgi:EAL domain-containing protein (putative c-di-GMP-specific phosphodiesterase class I)